MSTHDEYIICIYFSSSYTCIPLFSTLLQPYDDRLQALAKAGFKLAAGIPFDVSYYSNICLLCCM